MDKTIIGIHGIPFFCFRKDEDFNFLWPNSFTNPAQVTEV